MTPGYDVSASTRWDPWGLAGTLVLSTATQLRAGPSLNSALPSSTTAGPGSQVNVPVMVQLAPPAGMMANVAVNAVPAGALLGARSSVAAA